MPFFCFRERELLLSLLITTFFSACALATGATGGAIDPTFDPGSGPDVNILTTSLQRDGKIIIGGNFTEVGTVARNHIARLNSDGTLDLTFDPGTGADSNVWATAVQPDGKILIFGEFRHVNGLSEDFTARLNGDGSVDTNFYANLILSPRSDVVYAGAVQTDGKILVGGQFGIERFAADGHTFGDRFDYAGSGANNSVFAIALQTDGRILMAGVFTNYDGTPINRVARLTTDGYLDPTFQPGTGAGNTVQAVAVQPDGKIIIAGDFTSYNENLVGRVARLNADGTFDAAFVSTQSSGASDTVQTITLQPDGKIIIAGAFNFWNSNPCHHIARLNADGSFDTTFDTSVGADSYVWSTQVQTDGKVIVAGNFGSYNGVTRNRIARLLPAAGNVSFVSSNYSVGEGAGNALITANRTGGADTRVVAKVSLTDITTSPADYAFSPGLLDKSFDAHGTFGNGANTIYGIALQPDGKVLVGGYYFNYGGTNRNGIARLNADGSFDGTFDPGFGTANDPNRGGIADVLTVAVQPDGKILVAGDFTLFNQIPRSFVARLNTNGSLDTTFDAAGTASEPVRAMSLQPDGKVIIAGDYITVNGNRTFIARLNTNGTVDATFQPGATVYPSIDATCVQADGKVLIGGDFYHYLGTDNIQFFARLNSDGTLDEAFDSSGASHEINSAIAVQPDGKILVGSLSATLKRFNADGSIDPGFDTGTGPDGGITALALQPDGKIIIVGDFTTFNDIACIHVARINIDGSLDTSFNPGKSTETSYTYLGPYSVALQPDGEIFIGGAFTNYNGVIRRGIARIENGDFFFTWPAGDSSVKTFPLPIVDDTLVEGNETLKLTLGLVSGGAGYGAYSNAVLTIVDNDGSSTYMTWQQSHFTPTELTNPSVSGDSADPDGDGLKNIFEYAFGLDPKSPNTTDPISTTVDATYVSIIYPKLKAATDITFIVEKSTDLVTWTAVTPINVILSDDGAIQVIKAEVLKAGSVATYLRLGISH
jgi:uncharacterized delta-60 repeat protein